MNISVGYCDAFSIHQLASTEHECDVAYINIVDGAMKGLTARVTRHPGYDELSVVSGGGGGGGGFCQALWFHVAYPVRVTGSVFRKVLWLEITGRCTSSRSHQLLAVFGRKGSEGTSYCHTWIWSWPSYTVGCGYTWSYIMSLHRPIVFLGPTYLLALFSFSSEEDRFNEQFLMSVSLFFRV